MICFGLATVPCSKLIAVFQGAQAPIALLGRLGMTGTIVALSLLTLRALAELLVDGLHGLRDARMNSAYISRG